MIQSRMFVLEGCLTVAAIGFALVHADAQSENKPSGKPQTPAAVRKEPLKPQTPAAVRKEPLKAGKDRWLVKTASDPDAVAIGKDPVKTTVESLLSIVRPEDMPLTESNSWFAEHRARPAETTLWRVEADVIGCQLMSDGDYRVTIRGVSGKTMVLEMPDPDPVFVDPKSGFAARLKSARVQFESKGHPERVVKEVKGHAIITGIGFFGRAYGKQAGEVKGNLIQLHPVVNFVWLDAPTKEFIAAKEPEQNPQALQPTKPR